MKPKLSVPYRPNPFWDYWFDKTQILNINTGDSKCSIPKLN